MQSCYRGCAILLDQIPFFQLNLQFSFHLGVQGHKKTEFRIPCDGNIGDFAVDEIEKFLQHMKVNGHVITKLKQKGVTGKKFAAMDDGKLDSLGIKNPVIQYFRDRSKIEKREDFRL